MSGFDLALLGPEAALSAGVAAVLISDLLRSDDRRGLATWIGVAACAVATWLGVRGPLGSVDDMLRVDSVTALARPAIALITALLLIAGHPQRRDDDDHGAWVVSVLGLALGSLVTAAAANLVSLWLGVELMSLAGYSLAAWRGGDRRAAEAGMKYVLFGGFATGLSVFGISHVYGLTGHLDFAGIGAALGTEMPLPAVAALCLAGVGLAYKLAVVPFHFYAPDVYQGAPALSVATIAVLPKLGAIAALVRAIADTVPAAVLPPSSVGLGLAGAASLSLLFAAFTAIAQRDAKRIVAFSAIGHAGAVLLAVACLPGRDALAAAAFYLAGYAAANLGALVCLDVLEREHGSCALRDLAGAMQRRPWLVTALCLFLFSLAGLPPLAGFLGKLGVLREALRLGLESPGRAHLAWASLALVVSTVVSAWSYLLIVRAAVLVPAGAGSAPRPRLSLGTGVVVTACVLATVGLGFWLDGFAAIGRALD